MSVINETLDNLKQAKKRGASTLSPSSSVYSEKILKTEKQPMASKTYIIPISFAITVGVLFYVSQIFFANDSEKPASTAPAPQSWFKANLQKIQQRAATTVQIKNSPQDAQNLEAQKLYYHAMALLNEGQEEQALQSLQKILAQYPDFAPAQKVYGMLRAH